MKQRKSRMLIVILGLIGLVVVAALIVPRRNQQADSHLLLPTLAQRINDAAVVELVSSTGSVRLERQGDGWVIPDKTSMPARLDKIRPLIVGLSEMKTEDARTSNPDLYGRIGVQDIASAGSGTLVTISDVSGDTLASIIVGIATREGVTEQRYVRQPNDAQSWLVPATIDVSTDPIHWMVRELTRIDGSSVQSVNIIQPDGTEVGLARADTTQTHFDVAPIPAGFTLRSPGIADPISRALTNLNLDDVRQSSGELLGTPIEVVYQTFDGLVISIQIYDQDGEKWAIFDASSVAVDIVPEQLMGLQSRFKGREFKIPTWAATNLSRRMSELIEPAPVSQPEAQEDDGPRGPVLDWP